MVKQLLLFILIISIPFFLVFKFLGFLKTKNLNINIVYLLKFLFLYLFIFIYYIWYIFFYGIFFIFKNYRFFGYYYQRFKVSKVYYQYKSIYFFFWRHLTIYLILCFYNVICFSLLLLKNNFLQLLYINNIYIFIIIFMKLKYFFLNKIFNKVLNIVFKAFILVKYYIFFINNLDFNFKIIKKIKNFKYLEDPIGYRNNYIKMSKIYFEFYKYINDIKFFIYFIPKEIIILYKNLIKKIGVWFILFFIHRLRLYFDIYKNRVLKLLLVNTQRPLSITILNRILIINKFIFYYFNLLIINILYIILINFMNLLNSIFKLLLKVKNIIFYIIIIFLFFKYYWIIFYFFMMLNKHYSLYIPIYEIKETTRFFNFEWIDLRNYYNLIMLHNTLIDITQYNNLLYNDLVNNLNKNLSVFGFKVTQQYNIGLYSCWFFNNKDTNILNKLLNIYNKIKTHKQLKKYNKFRKIFALKVKELYKHPKIRYRTKLKKEFELSYNTLVNSNNISDSSYFFLKKGLPLKNSTKMKIAVWNYYNRFYIKKRISKKFIVFNLGHYLKLKKIPLRYIWLYKSDSYFQKIMAIKTYNPTLFNYFNIFKIWKKNLNFIYILLKQRKVKHNKFFFGTIYNFNDYNYNFYYKYNIPTYNWTVNRWLKRIPNKKLLDPIYVSTLDENQTFKSILDTPFHRGRYSHHYNYLYLKIRYPYRLYNINYLNQLQYFKILNNNIKLIKKYNYFINNKIQFNKRYYKIILESKNLLLKLVISKLKLHDEPFIKNYFNNFFKIYYDAPMIDLYSINVFVNLGIYEHFRMQKIKNFWYFFDYLKVNKFYTSKYKNIYKNFKNINLFFVKKTRKDYIKFRGSIIRLISLYNYYYNFELMYTKNINKIGDRNFLVRYRYDNLKLNWFMNTYLTNDRQNVKLFKNIKFLVYFFKLKYMSYFAYCDYSLNMYNEIYNVKVKTYKLKVLNKINNLKRFFFNHNKYNNGWSLFKYLNSFSLKFHIKHLIWHSPYSFMYFDNNNMMMDLNKNSEFFNVCIYIFDYKEAIEYFKCNTIEHIGDNKYNTLYMFDSKILNKVKERKQQINRLYGQFNVVDFREYSVLFNLYLNENIIKEEWYSLCIWNKHTVLLNELFYNYYSNGLNNNYNNNNNIKMEFYRILIVLLYQYYNNFLYRIIRYRYILDFKNYTFLKFIKRYFNIQDWFWHSYIRLRIQIYKYLYYGKMFLKRNYMKTFKLKNLYTHRIRQIKLISFWFYFDKYIKLFIYFLINKYYTKSFFILYWLNDIYNLKIILFFIYYYGFLYDIYIRILSLKNANSFILKLFFFIKNVIYIFNQIFYILKLKIQNIVNINVNEIKWLFLIIFDSNFKIIYFINYKILLIYIKYYFFYFNIKFLYKLNNIILLKIYIEKIFNYYLKIVFNFKNSLVYFKSNYYFFRKQRSLNKFKFHKKKKILNLMSFLQTNIIRKIGSFRHLTYNVFLFKNLYLLNLYNFIYLFNSFNFDNINIFNLFLFVIKNNLLYYLVFIYLIIYWIVLLLIYILYNKFFNILFLSKKVQDFDNQKNWKEHILQFKKRSILQVLFYNNKNKYLKKILILNKKWKNYYNFILFSNEKSYLKRYYIKIFLLSKLYKQKIAKISNNNKLLNIFINNTKKIESNAFFYKIFNFIKKIQINKIVVQKENKKFNFYYYNLLNNNLLNFCFLYWLILVPYFFFEFLLIKYHLKGHIRKKRQWLILIKVFLENFKLYINFYRCLGKGLYNKWKCKIPKNYYSALTFRKKKKLRHGFFFKWDRYQKVIRRASPLGSYFYWYLHINKLEYFICYFKYYFISCYYSNYFFFIYFYFFLFIFIIFYYKNNIIK